MGIHVIRMIMERGFNFNTFNFIKIVANLDNQLSIVGLTLPNNGLQYTSGDQVMIEASTMDVDGSVEKVVFHANDLLIAEGTTALYQFNWTAETEDSTTYVIATDDKQETFISENTVITVISDNGGNGCTEPRYADNGGILKEV